MTTFAELVTLTTAITKRPENAALTESAVRTAVLRAHHTDFFPRDMRSVTVTYAINTSAYYYDLQASATLPQLRTLKTVYGVTDQGQQIEQLEFREPDNLYASDGDALHYVYTLIGDTLRCYFDMPTGFVEVFYYANPVVTSSGFSSWIADAYPDQIANWAASIVFARTGFIDMANQYYEQHVKPFKEDLIASHLLATVN